MRSYWLFSFAHQIAKSSFRQFGEQLPGPGIRMQIYLPANPRRSNETKAYRKVVHYLDQPNGRLPLTGYTIHDAKGAYRRFPHERMTKDATRCVVIEDCKPAGMTDEELVVEVEWLRAFIGGVYFAMGCPQDTIMISTEPGARLFK